MTKIVSTTVAPNILDLLAVYSHAAERKTKEAEQTKDKDAFIYVNEAVGRLAFLYERARNAIDYKDEHLLRKNAIARILRRAILLEKHGAEIAEPLIQELIRASYLGNGVISKDKGVHVQHIISKYLIVMGELIEDHDKELDNWVWELAACEIEEYLVPPQKSKALVQSMYQTIKPNLKIKRGKVDAAELDIQLLLAVNQTLIKCDRGSLEYLLFRIQYHEWEEASEDLAREVGQTLGQIYGLIKHHLDNPLQERMIYVCRRYSFMFLILEDVIETNHDSLHKIMSNPKILEAEVIKSCDKKYKEARSKLQTAGLRSIIYIFITKVVLAFVIEFPVDYYILEEVNYIALGVNVMFPPTLMFFITAFIEVPSTKNTELILDGLKRIIYTSEENISVEVGRPARRNFLKTLFYGIYSIAFMASFGAIVYGLYRFGFSVVSIVLFLFFLCLVSFFGVRIRRNAREFLVQEPKDSFSRLLFDLLALPFLKVGYWMSEVLGKINVFVILFDFLFEAPFKKLIAIMEDLVTFIKEKREELY